MSDEHKGKTLSEIDPRFWQYPVPQWIWDAAYMIDSEVGLPRFDLAISVTAHIIARSYTLAQETAKPPPEKKES